LNYQQNSGWSISGFDYTDWVQSTPSSPVVYSGNPSLVPGLTVDQRGAARFANGKVDIGAYQTSNSFVPSAGATAAVGPQLPSASVRQVSTLYQLILGRRPGSAELNAATGQLASGVSLETLALKLVQSPEYRTIQVRDYFLSHLKRTPTTAESNYFVNKLLSGSTPGQIRSTIIGSSEYRSLHPNSTDFVQSLFVETMSRAAIAKERKNLGKMSQVKAVNRVMGMAEYFRSEVADIYLAFGRREATKRELNVAARKLRNNLLTSEQLSAQLAGKLARRS
jgi:hypothetical protein